MKKTFAVGRLLACAGGVLILGNFPAAGAAPVERVPNTTLKMPSAPPTFGFTSSNAFPTISFTNPVCIVTPPGETNRLFIAEKRGRIVVITNLAAPTRTIFLDLTSKVTSGADTSVGGEEGLLGLAFHPGYATNRNFYVSYTGNATTTAGTGRHDILSRYQISAGNPNQGDATSETRLIVQYDEANNHNGGDLHFGPDGYLYESLGDEGGADGQYNNHQRIDKDFFSAILRLDVDRKPGSLAPTAHASLPALTNYSIPADNPWVGATTFNGLAINTNALRAEFWAVGMRNPWRFSFDPPTGRLYLGHVGQNTREWIDVVTRGFNSGWNYYEGTITRPGSGAPPAGLVRNPPLIDYAHTPTRLCVIGGFVYRGDRLSQLTGSYLYADYNSGEIWSLRHTGNLVTQNTIIMTDTPAKISSFGIDPVTGDPLYIALRGGVNSTINRIIYNTTTNGTALPATLADTGVFANPATLQPNAGIVPYDLNVPFWSDNAIKSRWFSLPNTNLTISFSSNGNWSFPTGMVWIKHFDLELTNGAPASRQRLETRLLVKNSTGLYGVTYRWGNSVTNASLVAEGGMDEPLVIYDGAGGILRTQIWHYPARNECLACHTPEGGFGLGFRTEQLNRNFNYGAATTNQIAALSDAGYFNARVTNIQSLAALAPAGDTGASLEWRARSFLAANCSQCHQPGGSAQQANWDARIATPLAQAGIINGALANNLGNPANRVIKPLSLANSALLTRISTRGAGTIQMPPLATALIDTQDVALVSDWILSLPPDPVGLGISFSSSAAPTFVLNSTNGPPNQPYSLLTATNITLPLSNWSTVLTGAFGAGGSFNFTNVATNGTPQFYRLRLP